MTQFPWRIFRNGSEVVFPEGARRFVSVDVRPISHSGGVERTLDGGAVWTGDPAFRLHEVQLSCSDQTLAPVFDLWPSQTVVVELPTEFSVPGPSVVLPHDPVAGSVYGVDAADEEVGRRSGAARAVSVPGAVAIRYRPRLECIVVDRQADATQWRGQAGWSLTLEEESGVETGDEEAADWVKIQPLPLQVVPPGGTLDLDFGHPDLTSTNTGLPVQFSLNFEDVGGPRITAAGRLTWSNIPPGAHAYTVNAISGNGVAEQVIAIFAEVEDVGGAPSYGFASGGTYKEWSESSSGRQMRGHAFLVSGTLNVTKAGLYRTVRIGGGGPGATANPGGGGSGGEVIDRWEWIEPGSYPVVVGAGGSPGSPGTATTFNGLSALGGKNAAGNAGAANSTGIHVGGQGDSNFGGGGAGCSSSGGGGAGSSTAGRAGDGGAGVALTVLDMPLLLGGGGGGGKRSSGINGEGRHGGGHGASFQIRGVAGAPNTGGGGAVVAKPAARAATAAPGRSTSNIRWGEEMATIALFDENGLVFGVIRAPDDVEEPAAFAASLGLECAAARFTSYSANFGGHYAAIGDSFDEGKGIYIAPQPFPSWLLDEATGYWNPPTPMPDDGTEYDWNEPTLSWLPIPIPIEEPAA